MRQTFEPPGEKGIQSNNREIGRSIPYIFFYFAAIGSFSLKRLQISTDLLSSMTNTGKEPCSGINIDDLERLLTLKIRCFRKFSRYDR